MTKAVRIENADMSKHKVVVELWDHHAHGDVLVRKEILGFPTAMAQLSVFSGRYLIIRELDETE